MQSGAIFSWFYKVYKLLIQRLLLEAVKRSSSLDIKPMWPPYRFKQLILTSSKTSLENTQSLLLSYKV